MPTHSDRNLSSTVLNRIAEEHVIPRPRWQFLAKNAMFWLFWAVSTIVAAIASSAIAFTWVNAGWEFREFTHGGLFPFLFEMMPIMWMAALIVVLFVAYENMRHTAMGYRYPLMMVLGLSLLTSVLLGGALFLTGIGARAEEELGRHIPMHRSVFMRQQKVWADPSRGLLAGELISVDPVNDTLMLRAMNGTSWQVGISSIPSSHRDELAHMRMVRVIGIPAGTSTAESFHACAVFPWRVQGGPPGWNAWLPDHRGFPKPVDPARTAFFIPSESNASDPCAQLPLPVPLRMMHERVGE